ncbi:MAG: hypothetical protein V2I33_25935 [Kangiellaceae bacterium]|nr:hypothetical protein [Kangiellaceae bacterium]
MQNHYVFNGRSTALLLEHFIPSNDFYLAIQFRSAKKDDGTARGSLFSLKANVADPSNIAKTDKRNCSTRVQAEIHPFMFNLWVDSCGMLRASLNQHILKFDREFAT